MSFFVVMLIGEPSMLGLDTDRTLQGAKDAVSWQAQGGGSRKDFVVCTRKGPDQFKELCSGKVHTVTSGCFTQVAWDKFIASWSES